MDTDKANNQEGDKSDSQSPDSNTSYPWFQCTNIFSNPYLVMFDRYVKPILDYNQNMVTFFYKKSGCSSYNWSGLLEQNSENLGSQLEFLESIYKKYMCPDQSLIQQETRKEAIDAIPSAT
jgi:hypothetical protein